MMSRDQERTYREQGYLVANGLIPAAVSHAAHAAMRKILGLEGPEPVSWDNFKYGHQSYDDPALLACFTGDYCAAAAQLAGEDPTTFKAPGRAYAINVFPTAGEWQWPQPHIDHAIKEHGHFVFPRAFRIASMLFLSDVPPHGGGTVVWPGSQRKLEALARSDPQRYDLMWSLNQDLDRADLGAPVELTPQCGDVLFYHYLCAHAGSKNVSDRPRLALNMKW